MQEVGGGTSSSMAGSSAAAAARAQAGCESGLHSARISFNLHTSCASFIREMATTIEATDSISICFEERRQKVHKHVSLVVDHFEAVGNCKHTHAYTHT